MTVRSPAVAGLFYPGDRQRLQKEVTALLAAAPAPQPAPPKAIIAPHAGYLYSGPIAAAGFAPLSARAATVTRVVLIGPTHHVRRRGIIAPSVDAFATPLGSVPVDRQAVAAIADLPFMHCDDAAHAPEHSLEVELPFLQRVLPSFALVPLLVGDAPPQAVADVLRRLWGGPETLIVVSSDLSHYHDYDTAQRRDRATAAAIERGHWQALGPHDACGYVAVAGLLIEADRRALRAHRLAMCNSGDTAGERGRVVGYGAWSVGETAAVPS